MKKVLKNLTLEERRILSNQLFSSKRYSVSVIKYVYFIVIKRAVVYVGITGSPISREKIHFTNFYKKGVLDYKFKVFGPFKENIASIIEATETYKKRHSKKLLNINNKKNERREKFSVTDYSKKGICILRKGGKAKTVVC